MTSTHNAPPIRPTPHTSPGFTVVELLVVIAIIALEIALLVPAIGKARQMSRIVGCQSKQRNLALAYRCYADENDDICSLYRCDAPHLYCRMQGNEALDDWYGPARLYKAGYIDNPEMLYCPDADTVAPLSKTKPFTGVWAWLASYSSRPFRRPEGGYYGFTRPADTTTDAAFLKFEQVRQPQDVSLIGDLVYRAPIQFHNDSWNILFVDGHVENVRLFDNMLQDVMVVNPPYLDVNNSLKVWQQLEKCAGVAPNNY